MIETAPLSATMSQSLARTIFACTAAFFAAFFLWPILQILKGGFIDADGQLTFAYLRALLADPIYLTGLRNSFFIACATTVLALLIAVPLAFVSDRFVFPAKGLLRSVVLIPMILPPFVGAIGIKQIFGQYGAFNSLLIALNLRPDGWTFDWFAANQFWGVVVVEALTLYPIIYLNAVAALANIDPAMEEAAQNLGSTGFRRFRKVTLPLIKPGLFAGGTIVFIWSFTELGTPLVFDYAHVKRPDLLWLEGYWR
ncbi:MAG TPA: ABC transporter permease subunit [Opitutus sp.]|nr:ABC transporter permease subunit [Opitutus sp.]